MSFSEFLTFILSFLFAYTVMHYTLTSWRVRWEVAVVVGAIFCVLVAVFATLAVAPLLGV